MQAFSLAPKAESVGAPLGRRGPFLRDMYLSIDSLASSFSCSSLLVKKSRAQPCHVLYGMVPRTAQEADFAGNGTNAVGSRGGEENVMSSWEGAARLPCRAQQSRGSGESALMLEGLCVQMISHYQHYCYTIVSIIAQFDNL